MEDERVVFEVRVVDGSAGVGLLWNGCDDGRVDTAVMGGVTVWSVSFRRAMGGGPRSLCRLDGA